MNNIELSGARKSLLLSIDECALISGKTNRTWHNWENGTHAIPERIAEEIRKLLQYRNECIEKMDELDEIEYPATLEALEAMSGERDILKLRCYQSACISVYMSDPVSKRLTIRTK